MPELQQQIVAWRSEMVRAGIKNAAVLDELQEHLCELYWRNVNNGTLEAFAEAVAELGENRGISREFSVAKRQRQKQVTLELLIYLLAGWLLFNAWLNFQGLCWLATWNLPPVETRFFIALCCMRIMQMSANIAISLLLLGRLRYAREAAIAWAGAKLLLMLFLIGASWWSVIYGYETMPGQTFVVFNANVRLGLRPAAYITTIVINLSILFSLTRPSVINLFQRKKSYV